MTRTAGAIDPTLAHAAHRGAGAEPDGALLSGSYVTVHFKIQRSNPPLLIPGTALLVDAQGVRVAVVEADGTLHYRPIEIGRDYGAQIEVLGGLAPSDVIASNLPGGLVDGTRVRIAESAASTPSPTAAQRRRRPATRPPTPQGARGARWAMRPEPASIRARLRTGERLHGRTGLPSAGRRRAPGAGAS